MAKRGFASNPIFIGGDGRSGTTLLSVILDSHPDLAVGPELHFNGPENLGTYLLDCLELIIADDPRASGKGLKENRQYKLGVQFAKRCHRYGVEFTELRALVREQMTATGSNLSAFEDRCTLVESIGQLRMKATGKLRWGIKIMREIRNLHRYYKIWPNAQFIHIIRDGRDVAASQTLEHGSWGYEGIQNAARGWVDLIEKTRNNGKGISLFEIRYESLVSDPEPSLRRLLAFLGVPWHENVLRHNQVEHSLFANPYRHASIDTVVNPINTSAVGRYRRDLTPEQIATFNQIAAKYLAEFGYEIGER